MDEKNARTESSEIVKQERMYFLHPGIIILLSFLPIALGFLIGDKWILPLLITIPSFLIMRKWLLKGMVWKAYAEMLLSCFWMTCGLIIFCLFFKERAAQVIINPEEYVADMMLWIDTGEGIEGTPSKFIPLHMKHLVMIIVGSIISAGFLGLYAGSAMMGWMNYYVAHLISETDGAIEVYIFGWPVWSVIRVAAFVLITVVLAQPMLHRFKFDRFNARLMWWLVGIAFILEGLDIWLKTVLGPVYHEFLKKAVSG